MPSITLTDLTVKNLKPVPGKRVTYLDKSIKGFGVRVTENGAKSFVLTYGEDRKRITIGIVGIVPLKVARDKARDILAKRQLNEADDTPSVGFDEALRTYLKNYATKNKPVTVYETTRLMAKYLEPVFKGKKLSEAKKARLVAILDDIESISVRRHFYAAAYAFFRWTRRYDHPNPLDGVERPAKGPARARTFTDGEFLTIWQKSLLMGVYGLLYRVLLVSGQRRNQIAQLHSDFIDMDKRTITWPAHLMKTNREFILPYGDLLHSLLPQGEGLLFTALHGGPFKSFEKNHANLLKLCEIPHFTRHDCRRFYSSTHSANRTRGLRATLTVVTHSRRVRRLFLWYNYRNERTRNQVCLSSP